MKRYILSCLCLLMACAAFAVSKWDGDAFTEPPLSGSTYTISTAAHLSWLSRQSASDTFEGYTFVLADDIDLGMYSWTPIGTLTFPFAATFNGQGHVIYNVSITSFDKSGKGVFGVVGEKGKISKLAIGQGDIFVKTINRVGGLAGVNAGVIDHCFSMMQVVAHDGTCVGGLVGHNTSTGKIEYCYNTSVITDASDTIGGLVGYNEGAIRSSYNIGYCVNGGAAVGYNATAGFISNVFCDRKMCRKEAGKGDVSGVTLVENTADMFDIFRYDAEWATTANLYPQLAAFSGSAVSLLSVAPLTISENRLERAEMLTTNVEFSTANAVSWYSPTPEVLRVRGSWGVVVRPCQTQNVIVEARLTNLVKHVYTSIKGYDVFTPGIMAQEGYTCLDHPVTLLSHGVAGRPMGGKDDDLDDYPYYYRIEKYDLVENGVTIDTVLRSTSVRVGSEEFEKYVCSADSFGTFIYRLYVHDSKCQLEYQKAQGDFSLTVFNQFLPGAINAETDTIYGDLPRDTTVCETKQPSGGDGNYRYKWYLTKYDVDYVNDSRNIVIDDKEVLLNHNSFDTCQLPVTLSSPGEYYYTRLSRDTYCQSAGQYATSSGTKHFVVFETLDAGTITGSNTKWCDADVVLDVDETAPATGGNGCYQYRWLLNGQVIPGANTAQLSRFPLQLEHDHLYYVQRQVKDDTGLMDWTTSGCADTIYVRPAFSPGSVKTGHRRECLTTLTLDEQLKVQMQSTALPYGEGPLHYAYLLALASGSDTTTLDTLFYDVPSADIVFSVADYQNKLQLPATVVVRRLVGDTLCYSNYVPSEGDYTLRIALETEEQKMVELCPEDLPAQRTHHFRSGSEQTFTVTDDGQTFVFEDTNAEGCKHVVTYLSNISYPPEVEVIEPGELCQSQADFEIDYVVLSGTPTHCAVTWDEASHDKGMRDTLLILDGSGKLRLSNEAMATGKMQIRLTFEDRNAKHKCSPNTYPVTFDFAIEGYIYRKWNDVLFIDNNDKNGYPDPLTDRQFVTYQWYKNEQPIEGANEQYYQEEGGLNGIYYAVITDAQGNSYQTCSFEARPLTDIQNQSAELVTVKPNIVRGGQTVAVSAVSDCRLQCYTSTGICVANQNLTAGVTYLKAPAQSGLYVLTLTAGNIRRELKLIVL